MKKVSKKKNDTNFQIQIYSFHIPNFKNQLFLLYDIKKLKKVNKKKKKMIQIQIFFFHIPNFKNQLFLLYDINERS